MLSGADVCDSRVRVLERTEYLPALLFPLAEASAAVTIRSASSPMLLPVEGVPESGGKVWLLWLNWLLRKEPAEVAAECAMAAETPPPRLEPVSIDNVWGGDPPRPRLEPLLSECVRISSSMVGSEMIESLELPVESPRVVAEMVLGGLPATFFGFMAADVL